MAKGRFPVLLVSLELLTWGASPASAFAAKYGLEVLEDLDDAELTRRYLTNARGQADGRMPDWQRIIDARVR